MIVAGAESGEFVHRFPITGNETVLDAIGQIQGLSRVSSKTMWVARAAPNALGAEQILPVDWVAITRGGLTDTNYQLLPGDRIYIVDDNLLAMDGYLDKVTTPIERLLHIASLGTRTVHVMDTMGRDYNRTVRVLSDLALRRSCLAHEHNDLSPGQLYSGSATNSPPSIVASLM